MLGGINTGLWIQSFGGFFALGILILILKWAFSSNRFGKKWVVLPDRAGNKEAYGKLKPVLSPGNFIEAEMAKLRLKEHGIRANVADTFDGPCVMVFEEDLPIAREVLKEQRG